jgi:hypothetical protein
MTDQELLSKAVKFEISKTEDIFIEKRGENSWCVSMYGTVIDHHLERHYEPSPSNRTQEFIDATRFSLTEAFEIANRYIQK